MEKIKVKTVYESRYVSEPAISEYETRKEAEQFVKTCLAWGIGIVSCEIIEDEKAHN